jgi:hypothetical protein
LLIIVMTKTILCPEEAADAAKLRAQRRLARYHKDFRGQVQALARRHPRLADLAASFPALLFALAAPRRGFQPEAVIARATEGAPLRTLAELAAVPLWLRKLPPEAFTRPLPALPDDDVFRREVANFLPHSLRIASPWMETVANAAEYGNEQIAIWIAREAGQGGKPIPPNELRLVCLWAWYCGQPGTTGHALCATSWQPGMRFGSAREAAGKWQSRVELHLNLGDDPVDDMWLEPGSVAGYDFAPLRSAADILDEARAMANCLATFGYAVATGRVRLWSMSRGGERVATVQVGMNHNEPLLHIQQLRRAKNAKCSHEEWWAARQWLQTHDLPQAALRRVLKNDATTLRRSLWVALWRPYWLAKRRIPDWLPLARCEAALSALR